MATPLDNAMKRLGELRAEIVRVERFIEDYKAFADPADSTERNETGAAGTGGNKVVENLPVDNFPRGRRSGGSRPSELVRVIERIIREVGHPMTRGELLSALEARDIEIPAQDKSRYIGTLVWRHKAAFTHVEGRGYFVRGLPVVSDHQLALTDVPEETSEEYQS